MGINFPNTPADNDVFQVPGGYSYVWKQLSWSWKQYVGKANPTNRIINSTFQVSQQNASTASALNTAGYYIADQWVFAVGTPGANKAYATRFSRVTPLTGSRYSAALVWDTNTNVYDPAAFFTLLHPIEGNRVGDLNWGNFSAKGTVLRFGAKASNPGVKTFWVSIRNAANDRSFVHECTFNGGQDTIFTIPVPPCTAGTWANDNTLGLTISFTMASGSNGQTATPDQWLAGNFFATSTPNGFASGERLEIFDVGFYADPLRRGAVVPFQEQPYDVELLECLRYWYPCTHARGIVGTASNVYVYTTHYVPMRITPATSLIGLPRIYEGTVAPTVTSINNNACTAEVVGIDLVAAAGGMTIGRVGLLLCDGYMNNYIAMNARM